jgi:septal ring factor EnvC (AmiA/AmiB activator)
MRTAKLHDALRNLAEAIRDVESAVAEMKADRDPLASHIFSARRDYRAANDTKSGKRREVAARLTYTRACELGFQGGFREWERLMGAATRR